MITIIGGGAIGLCSAYFLNKSGHEVQILECSDSTDSSGCSHGNAGMIVPSHFVPLAAPGVVRQGLKWLLNNHSPFYIKPKLDKDLAQWLWLFFRSANKKNIARVGDQLFKLNLASRDLYTTLIQKENFKVGYKHQGLMMLYQTKRAQAEEELLAREARQLGMAVDILSSAQVQDLESDFELNIKGGVHYFSDTHLNPGIFMNQLKAHLLNAGVKIHYKTQYHGFQNAGKKITHVQTNTGDFESDSVIIASGAWSQSVARKLGVRIPLQGGKGYSFTIENCPNKLYIPSILCERKIAVTPMGKHIRVAGTMEIAGTDKTVSPSRVQGIKEGVGHYLRNFNSQWFENTETWTGLRPVSPDGMPYIGKSKAWDNLFINTGHAMMGMSLAPVSGQILADIINGKRVHFNTAILSPDRF